jgi:ornithine cyclodeaminase/alanine dehydrogenase-like protein (mu-crystallin family)
MVLLLSSRDLAVALDVGAVIEAVERGFAEFGRGQVQAPLRQHLDVPAHGGVTLVMPSVAHETHALGTKLVSWFPRNIERGLARLSSLYVLTDYATGHTLAVMDGSFLTGIRTAAASAVATRWLAREDATSLGVFGTGTQAEHHVLALAQVRPLTHALVLGTSPEKSADFSSRLGERVPFPLSVATSAEQLVRECSLVVTATTAAQPLFAGEALRPGTHLDVVGSFSPGAREVDTATVRRATVVVDTYDGVLSEAGDLLIPIAEGAITREHVVADLAEIVLRRKPARQSPDEVTLFKSVGAAFQDVVAAKLAYDQATARGLGQTFHFE